MYTRIFAKLSNVRDDKTQKQDWEEGGRRQLFVASKCSKKLSKERGCIETFNVSLLGCIPTNCLETIFNFERILKVNKNVNLNSCLVAALSTSMKARSALN